MGDLCRLSIGGGKGGSGGGFAFYGGTVTAWRSNGNGEASTAVAIGHGDGSESNGTLALNSNVIVSAGADEGSATAVGDPSTWQCREKWVRMVTTYPVWVGDTQVTSANASNITGSDTPTASYNAAKKTLTLNGYTSEDWCNWGGDKVAIRAEENLTIQLSGSNTLVNPSNAEPGSGYGVAVSDDLTIAGNGTLVASDGNRSFHQGIFASNGSVTITGAAVTAAGYSCGIFAKSVTVSGGEVAATASGDAGVGVYTNGTSYIVVGADVTSLVASGSDKGIEGTVRNAIAGMGWTDAKGTDGKAAIEKNADPGRTLNDYKKVQFPQSLAAVTNPPKAKPGLVEGGSAQELVTAGTAEGGEMQYTLGKDADSAPETGWSASIPKGTKAGAYFVWYKAVGDASHMDSEAKCVEAAIAAAEPEPQPEPQPGPVPATVPDASVTAHVQRIGWMDPVVDGTAAGTTGKSRRMEALTLRLPDGVSGGIEYRGHVQQRSGWENTFAADGKVAGTEGKSLRMEAVQIQLTGEAADAYDVYYRVHVQRIGWMAWAKNGEQAGTQGMSRRAEAIQVVLVAKDAPAPDATYKGVTQDYAKAFVKK